MSDHQMFQTRADFRAWLEDNAASASGFWMLFGKKGGPATLKASEALEEALCFGWIDGQMKSLDETRYVKYFAPRRPGSKWSEKNKGLVAQLEEQGLMMDLGRAAIEEARRSGQWDAAKPVVGTEDHVTTVAQLLEGSDPARANYLAMSPSVQKTYARAYFDAKSDATRARRLAWMTDRLSRNLKPM